MQPGKHTTSQQHRYNVTATSWRCNDIVTTLWRCCVFAGRMIKLKSPLLFFIFGKSQLCCLLIRLHLFLLNYYLFLETIIESLYTQALFHHLQVLFFSELPGSIYRKVQKCSNISAGAHSFKIARAQVGQRLHCPPDDTLDHWLPVECPANTLIRLWGCADCSESSLGARAVL